MEARGARGRIGDMEENQARSPKLAHVTIRDLLWLTLVVAIVLWFQYARPISVERYQMEHNAGMGRLIILDTATGKIWNRHADNNWTSVPTPNDRK